jgi:hypothetical protein
LTDGGCPILERNSVIPPIKPIVIANQIINDLKVIMAFLQMVMKNL